MAYQYDIFISYKRGLVGDQWLIDHFIPLFQEAVENEIILHCQRDAEGLYFDQTRLAESERQLKQKGLEPGENWRTALRNALETSRCLLAVCSPRYFRSEWCMVEWETFRQRNEHARKELIVPITIHDGSEFPGAGTSMQYADFTRFFNIGAGFARTDRYVEFQDAVKELARRVAKVVAAAPTFGGWTTPATAATQAEPHIGAPKL